LLELTPVGSALVKRAEAAVLRAQDRMLAPLQPKDRSKLMELLDQLVELNNDASRVPQRSAV
jgi:DNA-binding MarR family transcriptional regulator